MPAGLDAARDVRRAEARPRRRRHRARLRPAGALHGARDLPPARALARAARAGRAPRRDRAAQGEARRGRALRAPAAAARLPAPDRPAHGSGRRRQARRRHRRPGPLPGRADPRRRDRRPGAARAARDRCDAGRARGGARGRRDRPRPRRRQLRGPPPLQRRAGRAGRGRCPVPVVSAVGHEQDTPLCDLAADARASTPTAAARLVVPDEGELRERLHALRGSLAREAGANGHPWARAPRRAARRARTRGHADGRAGPRAARGRPRPPAHGARDAPRAPARDTSRGSPAGCAPSRPRQRSAAGTRSSARAARSSARARPSRPGEHVDVQLAEGGFGAVVEETR